MRHDAQRNRARILAAAEAVFGERGGAGSTEEVARRAGVGIATVFRHFPTKEALVEAALVDHFGRLTARARTLAESPDPGEALRTLVREMVKTGATKITLASLVRSSGELPAGADAAARDLGAVVETVLRRAQDSGHARDTVTVDELYLLLRGLSQASATMPTDAATLRGAVDLVLAGIGTTTNP